MIQPTPGIALPTKTLSLLVNRIFSDFMLFKVIVGNILCLKS